MNATAEAPEIGEIVLAKRVDHLYGNTLNGQVAQLFCAAALVTVQWGLFPKALLLGWMLAAALGTAVRASLVLWYRRSRQDAARWVVRYRISLLVSGIIWGAAGILLFPVKSPVHQVYVAMVLVILITGGAALYSAVYGMIYWFILPAMPPLAFSLVLYGHMESYVMALLIGVVFFASIKLNHDIYQVYSQAFTAAEQLRTEKDIALQATREKDKYVSLIAHDLKSPFSSLIQLLSLFDADDDRLDEAQHAVLNSIRKRCEEALVTVDQVLHVSRFQGAGIRLKRTFLDGRMEALRVLTNFKHQAESKGIEVVNEVPEGLRIFADVQLYGEVLQNLVSNAVKFCRKGDRITLSAAPGEPATLVVRDTGIGIDPELMPGLFRQDVKTTRPGTLGEKGTGLGLPLCREIMRAHGGDLEAESTPGQGTVMVVRLPTVQPLVLVVDDDPAIRYALRKQLAGERFAVEEATNGETAIKKVADLKPHLVLLDVLLARMDGFAVLDRLKADPVTRDVPVIVTTSDSRMETRNNALNEGAADFLAKPIRIEDLVPRLLRALA